MMFHVKLIPTMPNSVLQSTSAGMAAIVIPVKHPQLSKSAGLRWRWSGSNAASGGSLINPIQTTIVRQPLSSGAGSTIARRRELVIESL